LAARDVRKAFRVDGRVTRALDGVSLEVDAGAFVTLVGPSGCGKSTLLNILCGLLRADEGHVLLHGEAATPADLVGRIGYMPQRDLLLPWRTVLDNLILGPEIAGHPREAAREEARMLLVDFGLAGFEDAYPATLSGGMRQRAALLRTFLCRREIVLLDEPLGALDALTRLQMRRWLQDVWARFGQTVVLVSHDVEEAVFLSDVVYVLSPRPARLLEAVRIDLPRPRADALLSHPRFTAYRRELLSALGV
jgi:ABC-type nitrate/sulfonate/bicarbonate transport system ATPase subunit